jgi:uroporphyrinogen III methyltransferase/synthase
LTSANGADLMMALLAEEDYDARALAGVTIAAIGPGTAAALAGFGLTSDVVPPRAIAESLAESLIAEGVEGKRVLIARASEARDVLPQALRDAGADVVVLPLYDTVREHIDEHSRERLAEADYVTFTSSSTVRYLLESIGGAERFPRGARVVSIGPITSETAREHGLEVHVEAQRHDVDGLLDALLTDALAVPAS